MKRKFKFLMIATLLVSLGMIAQSCSSSDSDEETECSSSDAEYRKGFEEGKNSPYDTPEEWKREVNNGFGVIGEIPPCWDEGFIDAKNSSN